MNWKFERLETPSCVLVTTAGRYDQQKFASMIAELRSLDYWKPETAVLVDNRALDCGADGYDAVLSRIDEFISVDPANSSGRFAVLFGPKLGFGLGGSEFGSDRRHSPRTRVFRREDEAFDWLS